MFNIIINRVLGVMSSADSILGFNDRGIISSVTSSDSWIVVVVISIIVLVILVTLVVVVRFNKKGQHMCPVPVEDDAENQSTIPELTPLQRHTELARVNLEILSVPYVIMPAVG